MSNLWTNDRQGNMWALNPSTLAANENLHHQLQWLQLAWGRRPSSSQYSCFSGAIGE